MSHGTIFWQQTSPSTYGPLKYQVGLFAITISGAFPNYFPKFHSDRKFL
jgi:hypothetical protein